MTASSAVPTAQMSQPVIQLTARSVTSSGGATEQEAQEVLSAHYVDHASDEEGVVIEAQIDSPLRDLEVLFQEQLVALVEDTTE